MELLLELGSLLPPVLSPPVEPSPVVPEVVPSPPGCSHRSEKGCAVRAALAEGKLSQTRYDSYCAMYDEVKDVKDWQRPKV